MKPLIPTWLIILVAVLFFPITIPLLLVLWVWKRIR